MLAQELWEKFSFIVVEWCELPSSSVLDYFTDVILKSHACLGMCYYGCPYVCMCAFVCSPTFLCAQHMHVHLKLCVWGIVRIDPTIALTRRFALVRHILPTGGTGPYEDQERKMSSQNPPIPFPFLPHILPPSDILVTSHRQTRATPRSSRCWDVIYKIYDSWAMPTVRTL